MKAKRNIRSVFGNEALNGGTRTKYFGQFNSVKCSLADSPPSEQSSSVNIEHLKVVVEGNPKQTVRELVKTVLLKSHFDYKTA